MQPFNPDIQIVAVDDRDVVVTFDSGLQSDFARVTKALRITRGFTEMSVTVEDFIEESGSELGDSKEFRGSIMLLVKGAGGNDTRYLLSQPVLRLESDRQRLKGHRVVSAEQVAQDVRQGVAAAFNRALASYCAKEAHMDTLARTRPQTLFGAGTAAEIRDSATVPIAPAFADMRSLYAPSPAANESPGDTKRFRRRIIAAAIGSPLVVFALLSFSGVRKHDPIEEAVAKSMAQNPRSIQSQVELTKDTLRQMGLDPGKSADVGCLAQP